jgi:hypothetical protein
MTLAGAKEQRKFSQVPKPSQVMQAKQSISGGGGGKGSRLFCLKE